MTYGAVKNVVRVLWNKRAPDFDEQASHGLLNDAQHDAWRSLLDRIAGPAKLDVVDVGCGTGFLALLFAELGHRAIGIDFAADMLAKARDKAAARRLDLRLLEGDAEAPGIAPASADLICMRHVIWTLPSPSNAARAWLRALRPGGRVLLVEGQFKTGSMREEYQQIGDQLPFLGGRPAEDVIGALSEAGFVHAKAVPLMDPALWLQEPQFPRYYVLASKRV
jgi:ubiquinone/menaquinone biosynthesis C-methylase UbiE